MHSTSKSYLYPSSSTSSASGGYSNLSSWATVPMPFPGIPYSAPISPPVCCPPGHPSSTSYTPDAAAHPALQPPYNAILSPQPACYSSEPATHPPVATLTLRLTPHPNTCIPSVDVTLSSPHPGPLTVHNVHVSVYHTLSRPITHSDLRALTEQVVHNAVSAVFHARTANDPNAFAKGMCVGDRMGGWCPESLVFGKLDSMCRGDADSGLWRLFFLGGSGFGTRSRDGRTDHS